MAKCSSGTSADGHLLVGRRHHHTAPDQERGGNLKGKDRLGLSRQPMAGTHPLLQERAKTQGYDTGLLPVTAPGVEQKATWLRIRQQRPDYVLLWGWGVAMTPPP